MVYRVDGHDRLSWADSEFREAARRDGAPELARADALGRSLWDFVAGADNRQLWALLMARVRSTRVPVEVPYRCDTPTHRRQMTMTLVPLGRSAVEFRSAAVTVSERAVAQPVFDGSLPRGDDLVLMCSWCERFKADGWHEVEQAAARLRLLEEEPPPLITHGVCDECAARVLAGAG